MLGVMGVGLGQEKVWIYRGVSRGNLRGKYKLLLGREIGNLSLKDGIKYEI